MARTKFSYFRPRAHDWRWTSTFEQRIVDHIWDDYKETSEDQVLRQEIDDEVSSDSESDDDCSPFFDLGSRSDDEESDSSEQLDSSEQSVMAVEAQKSEDDDSGFEHDNDKLERFYHYSEFFSPQWSAIKAKRSPGWFANSVSSSNLYLQSLALATPGTTIWAQESEIFQEWLQGKTQLVRHVALYGISGERLAHLYAEKLKLLTKTESAGSGKTVACAKLIKYARVNSTQDTIIIYHFFQDGYPRRMDPKVMVYSLIDHLLAHPNLTCYHKLCTSIVYPDKMNIRKQIDWSKNTLQFSALWALFCLLVHASGQRILVFLDGLDICADEGARMMKCMANPKNPLPKNLFLFITTTESGWHIHWHTLKRGQETLFTGFSMDNEGDIAQYAAYEVNHHPQLSFMPGFIPENKYSKERLIKNQLIGVLKETCQSNFRYAALFIQQLKSQSGVPSLVHNSLNNPPRDVIELYKGRHGAMIRADQETDCEERSVQRRQVLLWATLAVRPISVEEMARALLIEESGENALAQGRTLMTEYDMRFLCGKFVEYTNYPEPADFPDQRERPFGVENQWSCDDVRSYSNLVADLDPTFYELVELRKKKTMEYDDQYFSSLVKLSIDQRPQSDFEGERVLVIPQLAIKQFVIESIYQGETGRAHADIAHTCCELISLS